MKSQKEIIFAKLVFSCILSQINNIKFIKNMQELKLDDILSQTVDLKEKKVGYVTIIWRPNAGKSTFINNLLWEKVSIVSKIPQTTRKKILAIYNDEASQIIFFDTPWIHDQKKCLMKRLINKHFLL